MNLDLDAIKRIVIKSKPEEWVKRFDGHPFVLYELNLGYSVKIELIRWRNAGIRLDTYKLTGDEYDMKVSGEAIATMSREDESFVEEHFKRVDEFHQYMQSEIIRIRDEGIERNINTVIHSYDENGKPVKSAKPEKSRVIKCLELLLGRSI